MWQHRRLVHHVYRLLRFEYANPTSDTSVTDDSVYRAAGSITAFSYSCTCDDRDDGQRRQLIQFYSLTKHNLQTTHNPAGATARTAIRLTRATQSPLRTPAGNRLQTSSARVQDFLLNISYSRVNTHSHTVFRLPRQPSTACLLDRVLHHCISHTGFPQPALVATQLSTHCFIPTVNQLSNSLPALITHTQLRCQCPSPALHNILETLLLINPSPIHNPKQQQVKSSTTQRMSASVTIHLLLCISNELLDTFIVMYQKWTVRYIYCYVSAMNCYISYQVSGRGQHWNNRHLSEWVYCMPQELCNQPLPSLPGLPQQWTVRYIYCYVSEMNC